MKKNTSRRMRIIHLATNQTFYTDHFALRTIDFKGNISNRRDIVITNLRNRLRTHPQLRNEDLTLQHIYEKIQQCLNDSAYFTNERFGFPSAYENLLPLIDRLQEEGPT